MDQQGKSSNQLIMDKKLQNAGISKMGKSHGGNQGTSKWLQRSLREPVQLDILMSNLEKQWTVKWTSCSLMLKYSG